MHEPATDRRPLAGWSVLLALFTVALVAAFLGCGTAGPKDGGFCSHCGEADAPKCSDSAVIPDEDLVFFCGDSSRADCNVCSLTPDKGYVCTIPLICKHEDSLPAQRCYPTEFGKKDTALPTFECEGLKPGG